LRVFFQKREGWLKLSSSPELYLQKTTWWNELLPFSCNPNEHYYHSDDDYVNYLVHVAVFCNLTPHSCVTTYKTIQCQNTEGCNLKELSGPQSWWMVQRRKIALVPARNWTKIPQLSSPQPSHYTDWAIMAQSVNILHRKIYRPHNDLW
jgi:hypothetical protein